MLADVHAAEDVFQAVFLLLARKGASLRRPGSLAGWLHAATLRLAMKARTQSARRLRAEHQGAAKRARDSQPGASLPKQWEEAMGGEGPEVTASRREMQQALDEELGRLPEQYRTALVLCDLEGLTDEAAAARLGCPVGSVKSRLSRGRHLLSSRLGRRGLSLAALLVAAPLTEGAVPVSLAQITIRAAAAFAAGQSANSLGVSAGAADLVQGALRTMMLHKLNLTAAVAAVLALMAGVGVAYLPHAAPNAALAADETPAVFTPPAETPQAKADRGAVVKGNTQFALDLYKKLTEEKDSQGKNLFLSPYSISTALAMTYAGAREQTAEEMSKTLHFPLAQDRLHPAFAGLIGRFQASKEDRGYQLSVANALWGQKAFHWQKDFLRTTQSNYAAGLREVDFSTDTEGARKTINSWVEEQTKDKIKELLKKGVIDGSTRMVLTNAIYFKGDWKEQFDKKATKEEPFLGTPNAEAKASLMSRKGSFGYAEGDSFQVLELPYKGDELSMVVLLPKNADGLAGFEKELTAENLKISLGKLAQREVIVSLPKFKLTAEFSLAKQLVSLGMSLPFDEHRANFSGMTTQESLHIDKVVHKAFVDVNETGTEAAAATAVVMTRQLSAIRQPPIPVFRADHPFLFLIRDQQTGSILFLGRLMEPAAN
jgi:serpin B